MKIHYVHPFDISQTPVEADTDRDFERVEVGTCGIVDSNKFLVSLWNQLNTKLCPKHSIGRVPWAYFPGRYCGKKSHVSVIGFANTILGELYFAIMYRKKGDIDSILFMRPMHKLKTEEIATLSNLISEAIDEKDNTRNFICEAKIDLHLKGVTFAKYDTTQFTISSSELGSGTIRFNISAIDKFEAEQIALNKLYDACAFLTIETNVLSTFDEFNVREGTLLEARKENSFFVNDYIDYFPVTKDWKLCLSEYALSFLSNHIFINDRFEEKKDNIRFFLSACKHCQTGLEAELKLGLTGFAALPNSTFSLVKRDQKRKGENSTLALMSYLSAVECATASESSHETCKECGSIKYKIASRVKDIATEYLGEHLGKVFHKLYGFRSKFLHVGKFATDVNTIRTIPLLSLDSPNGLIDCGNFTIQVDGSSVSCSISNVREWTFYLLRSYYQKRILGRKEFAEVFYETKAVNVLSDLPLTIGTISPEGAKLVTKVFVSTDTISYKTKRFIKGTINRIKYLLYNFKRKK